MRLGLAWSAIGLGATALLCSCSSEPARQDNVGENIVEAPQRPAGGSRLRTLEGSGTEPATAGGDGMLGCALVDADGRADDPSRHQPEVLNRVVVNARGEILWNGTPIDAPTLGQYLDLVATMTPTPLTVVRTEPGADPKAVEAVRVAVARSLECTLVAY